MPAHQLLARIGYDQAGGPARRARRLRRDRGAGRLLHRQRQPAAAPGYAVLNANIHYATELTGGYAKRLSLYLEVRNLLDTTYVASAQNLDDTLSRTTGLQNGAAVLAGTAGSIFAGAPRNVVGGLKLSF